MQRRLCDYILVAPWSKVKGSDNLLKLSKSFSKPRKWNFYIYTHYFMQWLQLSTFSNCQNKLQFYLNFFIGEQQSCTFLLLSHIGLINYELSNYLKNIHMSKQTAIKNHHAAQHVRTLYMKVHKKAQIFYDFRQHFGTSKMFYKFEIRNCVYYLFLCINKDCSDTAFGKADCGFTATCTYIKIAYLCTLNLHSRL